MPDYAVSMIPAVRVSNRIPPEFRVYARDADYLVIEMLQDGYVAQAFHSPLEPGKLNRLRRDLSGGRGPVTLRFRFFKDETLCHTQECAYQVIHSNRPATGLIDGCWVSIYHWSEDEGRHFNPALREMTDDDFRRQIGDMASAGIKGVIIQSLFSSSHYAGKHRMSCEEYDGLSFYPSRIYPSRMPLSAQNPVEAILSAADEYGLHVLLGIGLFAWFDFSTESLRWHRMIAQEVFELYGNHASFDGWYISEEIFGDLYSSYEPLPAERWMDLRVFFKSFRNFVRELAPTKPVVLAPNNYQFHEFEAEWKRILPYIDILIPFAFARDAESYNISQMKRICDDCGTHMWVDMEMFRMPIDDGLLPKPSEDLLKEINTYGELEQNYGFQYTGIMNHPQSRLILGGNATMELYQRYSEHYGYILKIQG